MRSGSTRTKSANTRLESDSLILKNATTWTSSNSLKEK